MAEPARSGRVSGVEPSDGQHQACADPRPGGPVDQAHQGRRRIRTGDGHQGPVATDLGHGRRDLPAISTRLRTDENRLEEPVEAPTGVSRQLVDGQLEQLGQVLQDHVRAMARQLVAPMVPVDTHHETEPAGPPRLDPGHGILDHDAGPRTHPEQLGRPQVGVRLGFARKVPVLGLDAGHGRVEPVGQTGLGQHGRAVLAGGDDATGQPQHRQLVQQDSRVREDLDPATLHLGQEQRRS